MVWYSIVVGPCNQLDLSERCPHLAKILSSLKNNLICVDASVYVCLGECVCVERQLDASFIKA